MTVHFEPIPVGPAHDGPEFTFELREVTCEVCRAGAVAAVRAGRPAEVQVWEQRVPGSDLAAQRLHLEVDDEGRARVHESVLAQLLSDAGWERAS